MRKRTSFRGIWIVLLLGVVMLCGTAAAYMYTRSEQKNNRFSQAEVACRVHEVTDTDVTKKSSITVENTGNIDAWVRVRLVSYWVKKNTATGIMEIAAKPSVMPVLTVASGWKEGTDHTYYYETPLAAGAKTGNLLATDMLLAEADGCQQVVEVFAEAMQSRPESAVTESWHVTVSGGQITTVP